MPATSLDSRRLGIAIACAAAVGALLIAGVLTGRHDRPSDAAAASSSTSDSSSLPSVPSPSTDDTTLSVPATGDGPGADEGAATLTPADLEAAKATASEFAIGFSTYRFDEPAGAPLDRVRHLVSQEVAATLGDNSGATAERQRQADRREMAEAGVDSIITGAFDIGHVLLNVVVAQRVTSTEGSVDRLVAYQVALARVELGWQITGVAVA